MDERNEMTEEEFRIWNERMVQRYNPNDYHENANSIIRWIERQRVKQILKFLRPQSEHCVLEVGVGAGNILAQIPSRERWGLDISPSLLTIARTRLPNAVLVEGNAEAFPEKLHDQQFDRIFCSEVLEHVQHPKHVVSEMAQVLKPHGIAVISVPNENFINRVKSLLQKLGLFTFFPGISKKMDDEWHLHAFDRPLLEEVVQDSFVVDRIDAVPYRWLPIRYVARLHRRAEGISKLSQVKDKNTVFESILNCQDCAGELRVSNEAARCVGCGTIYQKIGDAISFVPVQNAHPPSDRPDSLIVKIKNTMKRYPRTYQLLTYVFGISYAGISPKAFLALHANEDAIIVTLGAGLERRFRNEIHVDLFAFPGIDVLANMKKLPFRTGSVDAVICQSVLEHVDDPHEAFAEISRILRPDGHCYLTMPFMFPYHSSPNDYSRFTLDGIRFAGRRSGMDEVVSGLRHGPTAALFLLFAHWLAIPLSLGIPRLYEMLVIFFMIILAPIAHIFDFFFSRLKVSENIASGYYYVGRKR